MSAQKRAQSFSKFVVEPLNWTAPVPAPQERKDDDDTTTHSSSESEN